MSEPLTVYIDFKSPYAYLAIEPTRRMAKELRVTVNWLPFVLDIPSYLGAAKLSSSGEVVEQSRSDQQWSGVKYAYYDCRRYANLRGLTIRGTVKIWDTNLAAVGMLWAKRQGDGILQAYIDAVFEPFWKRELDIEDIAVIEGVLAQCSADVNEFREYALGQGTEENVQLQRDAFDSGIFGVPSYVLGDSFYFGREHLPRLRWLMTGQQGPAPDIAYELEPDVTATAASSLSLDVGISLGEAESQLVIALVKTMANELNLTVRWYELADKKAAADHQPDKQSRGARHRRYRALNRDRDAQRYGSVEHPSVSENRLVAKRLLEVEDFELLPGALMPAGFSQSPVFLVGDERYVGRQHLPLIHASFQQLLES